MSHLRDHGMRSAAFAQKASGSSRASRRQRSTFASMVRGHSSERRVGILAARRTGAEFQRVQYLEHLDELGALIGARARWWKDPLRYWFGTVTADQYRYR